MRFRKLTVFIACVMTALTLTSCKQSEAIASAAVSAAHAAKQTASSAINGSSVKGKSDSKIQSPDILHYDGEDIVMLESTFFNDEDRQMKPGTINLPELDDLGRCGSCSMMAGKETMPTEKRGNIGMVKPSGWHTVRYDDLIEDKYLYNRSHLLGYQISSLNADERNLITGTRYMNATLMLDYENEVADYIRDTGNHVLYRVTPLFHENELVARGVLMEAESIEDDALNFCVFCYNVQPGIEIDYATGDSHAAGDTEKESENSTKKTYVLNTRSMKYHLPECDSVQDMSKKNKKTVKDTKQELEKKGYTPCGKCKP